VARKSEAFKAVLTEAVGEMTLRDAEEKTGLSYTAIWNWRRKGQVPTDPTLVRQLADGLNYPRVPFLRAAGYAVEDSDIQWDNEHFSALDTQRNSIEDTSDPKQIELKEGEGKGLFEALSKLGEVLSLADLPIAAGTLPSGKPEYREGETAADFTRSEGLKMIFGTYAVGDSMIPFYQPNALVLIRPIVECPQTGNPYVVVIDGDTTCKVLEKIEYEGDEVFLTFAPVNSLHPRLRINRDRVIFQGVPITSIPPKDLQAAAKAREED
jgi:hypothetical protein